MLKYIFSSVFLLVFISACTSNSKLENNNKAYEQLISKIDKIFDDYKVKNSISNNYLKYYDKTAIDCNQVNTILQNVYKTDQEVRMTGEGDMYKIDSLNQIKVISIFANCKTDNLDETSVNAVFFMLQHTDDSDLKAYFYDFIKRNIPSNYQLAMYVDGFLMAQYKPQIFGTHLDNNYKLYEVNDRKNLNKIRTIMGMKPVEDYLKSRGVE